MIIHCDKKGVSVECWAAAQNHNVGRRAEPQRMSPGMDHAALLILDKSVVLHLVFPSEQVNKTHLFTVGFLLRPIQNMRANR